MATVNADNHRRPQSHDCQFENPEWCVVLACKRVTASGFRRQDTLEAVDTAGKRITAKYSLMHTLDPSKLEGLAAELPEHHQREVL